GELEFGGLYNRQVGGLGALEDAAGIDAKLPKCLREIRSVAHQAADLRELSHILHSRYRIARGQGGKLYPPGTEENVGTDQQCVDFVPDERREGSLDLAAVARPNNIDLHPKRG